MSIADAFPTLSTHLARVERLQHLPCLCVPQLHILVVARGNKAPPIVGERDVTHTLHMGEPGWQGSINELLAPELARNIHKRGS